MSMNSLDVLFVDDDPSTRETVRLMLEKFGYNVTTATNGVEALDLMQTRRFPLLITDWEMPEMDGAELCKQVRRRANFGYTYTILLTRRGGRDNLLEGLECGADDYLTKPVDPAELLARLHTGRRITTLEQRLRQSQQEALRLSTFDTLTHTYNRRHLMAGLDTELQRARREHSPLSLVLCDIDHFKRINEQYGHRMGDQVLCKVAEILRSQVRAIDWVARFGAEQFALVLPLTPATGAQLVTERIRACLENTYIEGEHYGLSITAGFGTITDTRAHPAPVLTAERMLAGAERCLQLSKSRGRSQMHSWDETQQRELTEADLHEIGQEHPECSSLQAVA